MSFWTKFILLIIIIIVFISVCAVIGLFLDKKDRLKKQLIILNKKGYKIDTDFVGKGLCKFNLYLDNINKKIILYNGCAKVYNFVDLKSFSNKTENINDKICYVLSFQLGTDSFKIIMKYNVKDNIKTKYEELNGLLSSIVSFNNKKVNKKNTYSNKKKSAVKKTK